MSYKVAAAIYKSPWFIEPAAGVAYYEAIQSKMHKVLAMDDEDDEEMPAGVDPQKMFLSNNVVYAPTYRYSRDAVEFKGFTGAAVAVIPLDGALMKNDFCGYYGTSNMLAFFRMAEQTESVKEIILLIDSPGGTVDGTATFAETVAASTKKTTALVTGMACSAAYWIASACQEIILTSKTDILGSIGTMFSIRNYDKLYEEAGIVEHVFYATQSKDKNKAFTDAQKGDGKALIKELLDPMNNEFLEGVRQGRGEKITSYETVTTGKTFIGKDAVANGLADKIQSMEEAMKYISERVSDPEEDQQPSLKTTTDMKQKFQKFLALIGFAATDTSTVADIKLEETNLEKIEAALNERDELVAGKATLEQKLNEATTAKTTAEAALTTANQTIATQKTEIEGLKKADGPVATVPVVTEGDKFQSKGAEVDAMDMDFQKELNAKL
jgi:signal peptide peptidase SppA